MEISSLGNDQFHTEAIESSMPRVPPTTEPVCLERMLHSKRSRCDEKPTHRHRVPLLIAARESPHTATKTQRHQK